MMFGLQVLALLCTLFQVTGEPLSLPPEPSLVIETRTVLVPKGTEVRIRIDDRIGSKLSHPGDVFHISLAAPIVVDGSALVPAGTKGSGQVVHAAKAGFGGAAGELILAARFLDFEGRHIDLRSLRFGRTGDDNTAEAIAIGATIGVLGLLVKGGNLTVEPGTVANAKIARDTEFRISGPQGGSTSSQQGD